MYPSGSLGGSGIEAIVSSVSVTLCVCCRSRLIVSRAHWNKNKIGIETSAHRSVLEDLVLSSSHHYHQPAYVSVYVPSAPNQKRLAYRVRTAQCENGRRFVLERQRAEHLINQWPFLWGPWTTADILSYPLFVKWTRYSDISTRATCEYTLFSFLCWHNTTTA